MPARLRHKQTLMYLAWKSHCLPVIRPLWVYVMKTVHTTIFSCQMHITKVFGFVNNLNLPWSGLCCSAGLLAWLTLSASLSLWSPCSRVPTRKHICEQLNRVPRWSAFSISHRSLLLPTAAAHSQCGIRGHRSQKKCFKNLGLWLKFNNVGVIPVF